jgi:hypothetical protein
MKAWFSYIGRNRILRKKAQSVTIVHCGTFHVQTGRPVAQPSVTSLREKSLSGQSRIHNPDTPQQTPVCDIIPDALPMLLNLRIDVIKPASDNGSFMLGHYL